MKISSHLTISKHSLLSFDNESTGLTVEFVLFVLLYCKETAKRIEKIANRKFNFILQRVLSKQKFLLI